MKMWTLAPFTFVLLFSGCAPKPIDTMDEAQKYSSMSVPEFIKTRFYNAPSSLEKGFDKVTDILGAISTSHSPRIKEPKRLLKDGTVIYKAPFTKMNAEQLFRPITDLSNFCAAKGGHFKLLKQFNRNLASESAYAGIMFNVMHGKATINHLTELYGASPEVYANAQKSFREHVVQEYIESGAFEGATILNKTVFGVFSCTDEYNVSIIPIKYKTPAQNCAEVGSSPNNALCSVHTMEVAISPLTLSKK